MSAVGPPDSHADIVDRQNDSRLCQPIMSARVSLPKAGYLSVFEFTLHILVYHILHFMSCIVLF